MMHMQKSKPLKQRQTKSNLAGTYLEHRYEEQEEGHVEYLDNDYTFFANSVDKEHDGNHHNPEADDAFEEYDAPAF